MNVRHQINSYFAILLIVIFGSWATFTIVDVATTNVIAATFGKNNETVYLPLQQSILNSR